MLRVANRQLCVSLIMIRSLHPLWIMKSATTSAGDGQRETSNLIEDTVEDGRDIPSLTLMDTREETKEDWER